MKSQRRPSWMWVEDCALLDETERRQRRFVDLLDVPVAPPAWEPPVNVFSNGSELHVVIALPGTRASDISVQLSAGGLMIEALVAPPRFPSGVDVVRMEIPYGRMRRRIELSPGRYVLGENRLDEGYLFLRLTRF